MPMYGVQIAFKNYSPAKGIENSDWVGLRHFWDFYRSFYFWRTIRNTLVISLYKLLVGIPFPIILALLFQEIRNPRLRSTIQSISYAPNFMSVIVVVGMLLMMLSPTSGFIPGIMSLFGYKSATSLIAEANAFWHLYVWSDIWQTIGWGSLIYTSAISGIPTEQYEAATLDGASRIQQIFKVTIPNIIPTIVIITLLSLGGMMSIGYEKILAMQVGTNMETSEVISSYLYKATFGGKPRYSFSAMIGLFNSLINIIILSAANFVAKRLGETSLW